MPDALRFESVRFAYGRTSVFHGIDLAVARGEMTAVLGPNGTGKTTMIALAAGALKPQSGRVEQYGKDLAHVPSRERARRTAVVPQDTGVAFEFTVGEMVAMGRAPHLGWLGLETPADEVVVEASMDTAGVRDLASRLFTTLSAGERQRVLLARALAQQPGLLLLDEPTAHLDPKHALSIYQILTDLNRNEGLTVVLTSHDINLAARYCRRLVFLHAGVVAADGAPGDVLRPEIFRRVYEVEAHVGTDPITGTPHAVPFAPSKAT